VADIDPQKVLSRLADAIAAALRPERTEKSLEAVALKSADHAKTLRLSVGDKEGIVKLFSDSLEGRLAFSREHRALAGLQRLDVPKLLLVSERDRAILTRFIPGAPFERDLDVNNLLQRSEFLGQWFGRMAGIAPRKPAKGSWADYLANYETGFDHELLAAQGSLLKSAEPAHMALAHNDNALGNFILGDDKRLYAIDFEQAMMKPEGWDLFTAARAFFQRFPDDLQSISSSLLRGFRLTNANSSLPENFDQIMNVLVLANVVKGA